MTDQRYGVLIDDQPVRQEPVRPVPAPVSSGDIIGAHATLTEQDFAGALLHAVNGGYMDLVKALIAADPGVNGHDAYIAAPLNRPGDAFNYDRIWQDIAARRAQDKNFLKDVPATNRDEFAAYVQGQELKSRRGAQDVVSRQAGTGQAILGFGADVGTGLFDPVNLMTLPFGGGAKTIWGTMARAALVNGATEAVELPIISGNRARFGEQMTAGEMLQDVGTATIAGAALAGTLHVAGAGVRKAVGAALDTDAARAAALALQPLAPATPDDVVAAAFRKQVPPDIRTPDEQAALHVIDRQGEVAATNPYHPTPAGMDAHADNLDAATATVARAIDPDAIIPAPIPRRSASAGAASVSRSVSRETPDLTPDRIVRFVQNDLEGGATVVHFSQADGGTTKYGIAQAANPGVDVANLTEAQAAEIAHRKYWLPEFDQVDPRTAAIGFDAGYIGGPDTARRILAESGGDPARALDLYREHLNHIADTVPGKEKFRRGWNNRLDKLQRLVGGDDRPVLRPEGFADDADRAASQRAIDDADMEAQLAAHEAAMAARGGEGEVAYPLTERSPQAGAMEGSALPVGVSRETLSDVPRELPATVKPDAVSDVLLGPVFVAPKGDPGFHIEDTHGDGTLYSVFRDGQGDPKAVVRYPATPEARQPVPGYHVEMSTYVAPAYRRQGIATKLYDQLREAGHPVDEMSGSGDLTPDGAGFVNARRTGIAAKSSASRFVPRETRPDVPRSAEYGSAENPTEEMLANRTYPALADRASAISQMEARLKRIAAAEKLSAAGRHAEGDRLLDYTDRNLRNAGAMNKVPLINGRGQPRAAAAVAADLANGTNLTTVLREEIGYVADRPHLLAEAAFGRPEIPVDEYRNELDAFQRVHGSKTYPTGDELRSRILARREASARASWVDGRPPASQLSAAGDHAIGTPDIALAKDAAKGFDDPHGPAAREQVEGLTHDIAQRLDAGDLADESFATSGVEVAGGDTAPIYQNAQTILDALDAEDAALAAIRGCM